MSHITISVLLLSVVSLCQAHTIIYEDSDMFCRGNRYTHVYVYLDENTYCTKLQWCDDDHCCKHQCGDYSWKTKYIKILDSKFITPSLFMDTKSLLQIIGIQAGIESLGTKSFVNLESIQNIDLSFNKIRYIQQNVFVDVSASFVDLSWNKLIYIDEDAFAGLPNLKVLNLSHNELSYVYSFPEDSVLTNLLLSHNYLQRLVVSGLRYPKLEILDASFNNLTNIAITSESNLKIVNLTRNYLETLDVFDVKNLTELYIGQNNFEGLAQSVCKNVVKIVISPNPWNAGKLEEIISNCPVSESQEENNIQNNDHFCVDDTTCPDDQMCRSNRCFDPCKEIVCDSTSTCKTENHVFTCQCPDNFKRNPLEFQSPCYEVQCFVDEDCPENTPCNQTNLCDPTISVKITEMSTAETNWPWYFDDIDPVLGKYIFVQDFQLSAKKEYEKKQQE